MNILEGLIPGEDAPKPADASHLEKLFVFCLMWSVGALLELEDRKKVLLYVPRYYTQPSYRALRVCRIDCVGHCIFYGIFYALS